MDGLRNLRGWQWIFLLEGLFTVCFGIISFFLLPNGPDTVITFTPRHAHHCVARLRLDQNLLEDEKVTVKGVVSVLADLHVWVACLTLFCSGCCLFGLAYFSPSIVQALGYDNTKTQLMTVPPYVCAFAVTMVCAFCADRYQQRGLCAFLTFGIALIGAALAINGRGTGMRYGALVLLVTGIFSCAPCLISWVPNNTAGHVRQATAVAMAFIATSAGGIVSTWIYPQSSAPYYRMGIIVNLSLIASGMILVVAQIILLKWLNRRKSIRGTDILIGQGSLTPEEQFASLGDRHPDYRYTY
jgi:predicted MFS family arabinose efflux permease